MKINRIVNKGNIYNRFNNDISSLFQFYAVAIKRF